MSDLTAAAPTSGLEAFGQGSPSEVRDRIDAMNVQQIELRRNEIIAEARKVGEENLPTLMLHELAYIASKLRRTNVGPPKEPKAKKTATPKDISDLI